MLRNGAEAACGTRRAAKWCPIFVRRCTIGVNAKLPADLSFFKLRFSSDAPRIEFAGGERGDNRGTKCPDPKALLDGIQQRFFICAWIFTAFQCACNGRFGMAVRIRRTAFARVFLVFLRLSVFAYASAYGAQPRAYRPGLPGWRAQKASVTLSFRRPSGRRNGRQSSYKQNAEDGVRLNEKRRTMERREPVRARGAVCKGRPRPRRGRAWAARRRARRQAPNSRGPARRRVALSRGAVPHEPEPSFSCSGQLARRCVRTDPFPYFALLHPDDIALAHGNGRRASFSGRSARCCRARDAHGFSRENECRHRNAR